jgi:hypothetical protein
MARLKRPELKKVKFFTTVTPIVEQMRQDLLNQGAVISYIVNRAIVEEHARVFGNPKFGHTQVKRSGPDTPKTGQGSTQTSTPSTDKGDV